MILLHFLTLQVCFILKSIYIVYTSFAKQSLFWRSAMNEQIKKIKTGKKDGQLLIRINSTERDEFIRLCEELDTSAARELRKFIRSFVKQHNSNE